MHWPAARQARAGFRTVALVPKSTLARRWRRLCEVESVARAVQRSRAMAPFCSKGGRQLAGFLDAVRG